MKSLYSILFLIFILSISVFAQKGMVKIVFIDSSTFENEKTGIPELIEARKKLAAEFKPQDLELDELGKKINFSAKEINDFVDQSKFVEFTDPNFIQKKFSEHQKLFCELLTKTDSAKSSYEKRVSETVQPIIEKISKSLKQFAEQNGYEIIIDKKRLMNRLLVFFHLIMLI